MTATLRYLSDADVRAVMPPMAEVVTLVEQTLKHHGEGLTQMPPKLDLLPGNDAFVHAMPALVTPTGAMGMKWVAGYPGNAKAGLPTIQGTIVMNDMATGRPIGIVDAARVTAVRTAACTAVTAKHLADPKTEVITIIGCGVLGRASIEALLTVFPGTERMLAYDVDTKRQAAFADEVMTTFNLASIIPPDPQEAVEGAHVIVTAVPMTKPAKPSIAAAWIQTGTCCIALDFDSSFKPDVFARADLLVTDDRKQFDHYRAKGYFAGCPEPKGELGSIAAGKGPARPAGAPISMAVNLGLGILDVALGAVLLERAAARRVGSELKL